MSVQNRPRPPSPQPPSPAPAPRSERAAHEVAAATLAAAAAASHAHDGRPSPPKISLDSTARLARSPNNNPAATAIEPLGINPAAQCSDTGQIAVTRRTRALPHPVNSTTDSSPSDNQPWVAPPPPNQHFATGSRSEAALPVTSVNAQICGRVATPASPMRYLTSETPPVSWHPGDEQDGHHDR